jgi:hypothetical protein
MNFNEYFFGPLNSNWCLYFYILSVISFIVFIISIIILISLLFSSKKIDSKILLWLFLYSLTILIAYFERRILHGMCMNSSAKPTV